MGAGTTTAFHIPELVNAIDTLIDVKINRSIVDNLRIHGIEKNNEIKNNNEVKSNNKEWEDAGNATGMMAAITASII